MIEIRFIEFFLTLNNKNITLSIDDECVNVFSLNFFSMSAVYIMIYPPRLIYIIYIHVSV